MIGFELILSKRGSIFFASLVACVGILYSNAPNYMIARKVKLCLFMAIGYEKCDELRRTMAAPGTTGDGGDK